MPRSAFIRPIHRPQYNSYSYTYEKPSVVPTLLAADLMYSFGIMMDDDKNSMFKTMDDRKIIAASTLDARVQGLFMPGSYSRFTHDFIINFYTNK